MTPFWIFITALGIIAAIINFGIAAMRMKQRLVALVRGLAGLVSLALSVGIVVGKDVVHAHPPFTLTKQTVFIATGVAIFALLLLPSYVDQGNKVQGKLTLQQRAARPAKATVRLEKRGTDEWMN